MDGWKTIGPAVIALFAGCSKQYSQQAEMPAFIAAKETVKTCSHGQARDLSEDHYTLEGIVQKVHGGGEAITKANEKLRLFPSQIPGATKVQKYETTGATYCLVHIRQTHLPRESSRQYSSEEREEVQKKYKVVNNVQKDIYSILQHLIDHTSLSEIYWEGFTKSLSKESAVDLYESRLNREEVCLVLGEKSLQRAEESEDVRYAPGAGILFAKQGKLRILPAENEKVLKEAEDETLADLFLDIEGKPHPSDLRTNPYVTDHREDALLEIISKHHQPFAITVYGGIHNWQNNITEWNKKHPTEKFSLVIITPVSYEAKEKTSK